MVALFAAITMFLQAGGAEELPEQPEGAIDGVELVANMPEAADATALNFLTYEDREVLVANGRFGLKTYDITDPTDPELLGELGNDVLELADDETGTFWQNEAMQVDEERKLVFMARDPRAYDGDASDDDAV